MDCEQVLELDVAVKLLQECFGSGSKVLAGQDFRRTTQKDSESVADLILRLDGVFQIGYGNDL